MPRRWHRARPPTPRPGRGVPRCAGGSHDRSPRAGRALPSTLRGPLLVGFASAASRVTASVAGVVAPWSHGLRPPRCLRLARPRSRRPSRPFWLTSPSMCQGGLRSTPSRPRAANRDAPGASWAQPGRRSYAYTHLEHLSYWSLLSLDRPTVARDAATASRVDASHSVVVKIVNRTGSAAARQTVRPPTKKVFSPHAKCV